MSQFDISRRTAIVGDLVLCVIWLVLAVISGLDAWGWGWTAFFGIAAGERWGTVWKR